MKQFVVILIVLAVLGAGGYQGWKQWEEKKRAARSAGQPRTTEVQSRDIRFSINAAGDIGPADQVSVRPEVNGRISELPVDIGDSVKAGELLCRLDDQDLQIERSSRLTEIDGAKLQLEKAKRNPLDLALQLQSRDRLHFNLHLLVSPKMGYVRLTDVGHDDHVLEIGDRHHFRATVEPA